jgi:hypothetical protein
MNAPADLNALLPDGAGAVSVFLPQPTRYAEGQIDVVASAHVYAASKHLSTLILRFSLRGVGTDGLHAVLVATRELLDRIPDPVATVIYYDAPVAAAMARGDRPLSLHDLDPDDAEALQAALNAHAARLHVRYDTALPRRSRGMTEAARIAGDFDTAADACWTHNAGQ